MTRMFRVSLWLSMGYTKKEIANMTGKSVYTINEQTRAIYERSGSRNLADITRYVVSQLTGNDIDAIIRKTLES